MTRSGLKWLRSIGLTAKALQGIADAAPRLADATQITCIRSNLPVYILAGDQDPINHNLEWLKPLAARYRAAGLADVTEKYYRGGRHEMLNETNRNDVLNDLLTWLRRIKRCPEA